METRLQTALDEAAARASESDIGPSLEDPGDHRLPVELISKIIKDLEGDYRTLAVIALVNKVLCEEARRLLYRIVGFRSDERPGPVCLQKNPSFAKYVHKYFVAHDEYIVYRNTRTHLAPLCSGSASNVGMINLKELHLGIYRRIPKNLLKNPPFQLEVFRWTNQEREFDNLMSFLQTQMKLRRLEALLCSEKAKTPLYLPACADLEYLKGDRELVEVVLPGRKVSELLWIPYYHDAEGPFDHLSEELGHLKVLSFVRRELGVGCLFSLVAKHLRHLRYSKVYAWEPALLETLLTCKLPNLLGLVLACGNHATGFEDPLEIRYSSGFGRLFVHYPLLRFVDIHLEMVPGGWKFERWVPGERCDGVRLGGKFFSKFFSGMEEHISFEEGSSKTIEEWRT